MENPNQIWEATFIAVLVFFLAGLATAYFIHRKSTRNAILRPLPVVLITVFLSLVALFFPAYSAYFAYSPSETLESILLSVQTTLSVFRTNNELDAFLVPLQSFDTWVSKPYIIFVSILCIFAPILVLSFALSFVKELAAYCSYYLGYRKDVYIFSRLNEKSLGLMFSIKKHYSDKGERPPLIVFSDVFVENNSPSYKLYGAARGNKCICFKKDILSVRFDVHSKKAEMKFVIIGDDVSENNSQALKILEKPRRNSGNWPGPNYSNRGKGKTWLYLINASKGTQLLMDGKGGDIVVRRIDRISQFTHHFLWKDLWDEDTNQNILLERSEERDGIKEISVVIIGLGKAGAAMLKALTWFCQITGYYLRIDAFDSSDTAEEKLFAQCPDLLSDKNNHNIADGEARYSINIHSGIDTESKAFFEEIKKLQKATLVFVSLGDDDSNIEAAADARVYFERVGSRPLIYSVVHDPERISMLQDFSSCSGDSYDIGLIGSYKDIFSYDTIFNPELENTALKYHLKWFELASKEKIEEEGNKFWRYEYYRNSSIAQVIHKKAVLRYGLLKEKTAAELSEEEKQMVASQEHSRWNAYMRSEGYCWSGSIDPTTRNNLAKLHHLLIEYNHLPTEEKLKDLP